MAFILIFMMALAIVDTIVLLVAAGWTKKTLEKIRGFSLELQTMNNRLDCLDNQGHMFIKKLNVLDGIEDLEKHCSMMMDIEKAKVKALETFRQEIATEHKAICAGIEDRYNMIYEEFKAVKDILEGGDKKTGKGEERAANATNAKKKKEENTRLARSLKEAGMTNAEIAKEIGVSESTVRGYLKQSGIISPDEEDHLGAPQIDDPAGYYKFVNRIVDEKLNKEAVNGKTVTQCPFDATHGECDSACSDACHDCVVSARAFNLLD